MAESIIHTDEELAVAQDALVELTKDIKKAASSLTVNEARFLVRRYYDMQTQRIRAAAQVRELNKTGAPNEIFEWLNTNTLALEKEVQKLLGKYSKSFLLGQWARSITGIGPVISAGLMSMVDVAKCPTVGHVWSYAGLDPTKVWGKGQKRPWNADLKCLCWKIGQSFLKQSTRDSDIYGKVLIQRRDYEAAKNEAGDYREQALQFAEKNPTHAQIATYKSGKLPAGHILSRAERYAVKLFLSHYHHVAYELKFGTPPPKPYILTQPNHVHFLAPPNWPMFDNEAKRKFPALP